MQPPAARISVLIAFLLLLAGVCPAATSHGDVKQTAVSYTALRAGGKAMAAVVVEIHDGFHAQSHEPLDPNYIKFEITPAENPAVTFGPAQYPPGKVEFYPALGNLSVYTGKVVFYLPLTISADAKPGPLEITGKLRFQACDNSACFPPESPKFKIAAEIVAAGTDVKPNEPELFAGAASARTSTAPATREAPVPASGAASPPGAPITFAGQTLSPDAKLVAFLTAFLVGVVFNVMPCVLPVLPLKAMGFYEVSQNNRGKSIAFGAVFSAGLIFTFAVFGLLIFVFKAFDWGGLFTKSWFIAIIVLLLLGMAISTFGWFTVSVPTRLYNIAPRHDTFVGNFEFGILTALLSTPCTFGMFVGLLAWALTQPAIIGVLILVTVGTGMASPYFILSALPEVARRFPRTGPWAELVKQMMGFLLLLAAVYFARPFLSHVVHGEAFWWLPFAVIVFAAGYLTERTFHFWKGLVPRVVGVGFSLLLLIGALMAVRLLTATPFVWQPYSAAAVTAARGNKQIVLIEFTADWCGNCQWVEANVLHSKPIVAAVRDHDILMLKADVTQSDAPARPLLDRLNPIGSIPLTVIYSPRADDPIELTGIYSRADLKHAIDLAAENKPAAVAQR